MSEIRCEMFCNEPIGPDGDPGGPENKAMCPVCEAMLSHLCHVILPGIRKNGYVAPPGADVDQEFAAMVSQQRWKASLDELLAGMGIVLPDGEL